MAKIRKNAERQAGKKRILTFLPTQSGSGWDLLLE
jgi:hypothetical protein